MTVTGTTTYNASRDTVIKRALRMVGAYAASDTGAPSTIQMTDANDVLNMMLKDWQMDGLLWLKVFGTLFLNKGQRTYSLAPSSISGFSHCATAYIQTNLSADAAISASSVTVDSATGMANAGFIGIANDDGIIEWFYASISGFTISLFTNVGLTTPGALSVAASDGNVVYYHTVASQTGRPTRITSAVRKLYDVVAANGYEIPLTPSGGISRTDYEALPNKTQQGKIISYYYDPQMVSGQLYVWPTADTPNDKLVLTMDRLIDDMLASSDTFDMPQEALKAVSDCLALELEPEYPLDTYAFQKLVQRAAASKTKLVNYNRENVSTFFQMDFRQ